MSELSVDPCSTELQTVTRCKMYSSRHLPAVLLKLNPQGMPPTPSRRNPQVVLATPAREPILSSTLLSAATLMRLRVLSTWKLSYVPHSVRISSVDLYGIRSLPKHALGPMEAICVGCVTSRALARLVSKQLARVLKCPRLNVSRLLVFLRRFVLCSQ